MHGTRNFILILDETVFHPDWEVVVGLRDQLKLGYIGGFKGKDEDYSFIASTVSQEELSPEKLSRMSVHFVISRADSNKHVYQVDMIPRQPKKQRSDESSAGAHSTHCLSLAFS